MTETIRKNREIEVTNIIKRLPDEYLIGMLYWVQWMRETDQTRNLTDDEIKAVIELHPETAPFFNAVMDARKAGRIE